MSLLGSVIPSTSGQDHGVFAMPLSGICGMLWFYGSPDVGKAPGAVGWYVRVSKEVKVDRTADTRSQGR